MSTDKPKVLLIGLELENELAITDLLQKCIIQKIQMNMDALLEPVTPAPSIIITGTPKDDLKPNELAQSLRMHYQDAPLYLCSLSRLGFERKACIKNGFTDAFLMPMDTELFRTTLSEALAKIGQSEQQVFKSVKIIDVGADTVLDFDTSLFLPANKRYVKLSRAGDALDPERLEKIKKNKFNNVYVPATQMGKFYQYSAKRLRELGNETLSVTEKKEKLAIAVRDLISGMFTDQNASFETGQAVMKDCNEIVKTYILQGADSEWYARIQSVLGERGNSYAHAGNASTLAALFSMGLGVGKPDDLALAGLLHDIGIAELPSEIQARAPEDMTPEQFELYKKHPEYSVQLIKARKIIVPEIVTKTILQHHELYNGTGYPNGLFGDRICKEAQVLALADRFDYLTQLKPGRPLLTPLEAVEKLREEQLSDPSKIHYNPELLKKLLKLFPDSAAAS